MPQLDALAGGREHAGPGRVLDLGGDPLVLPGQAVVVRVAVVGLLDVGVALVVARLRAREAPVDGGRVEDEDPARLTVDEEAGVSVAVGCGLAADGLLRLPGGAAVRAPADHHRDVGGEIGHRGPGVVGGDERALDGPGQRRDAVNGSSLAPGRQVLGDQAPGDRRGLGGLRGRCFGGLRGGDGGRGVRGAGGRQCGGHGEGQQERDGSSLHGFPSGRGSFDGRAARKAVRTMTSGRPGDSRRLMCAT